ncbi:MAG TPA: class I SAM-dependent methyltransferase [Pseudomonadales bacterium]|nr:class I SAM-dependent methyltransferase [Pseudomonadales bacterium]
MPGTTRQHATAAFARLSLLLLSGLVAAACGSGEPAAAPVRAETAAEDPYEYRSPSRDGTGKLWMGREISHVMGHLGAGWLERPTRQREERTDLFIARLELAPDAVVADIGAGTGYFSFPIAARLATGRVLAVDIQPQMLDLIRARQAETGVTNIEPVLGTITDPGLPDAAVDLAFIVDAYHEFSHPLEMGEAIVRALRPGGRLVLVEYRAEDPGVPIKPLHTMTEAQARREMEAIGLRWVRTDTYLPQQHVLVFEKPGGSAPDSPGDPDRGA